MAKHLAILRSPFWEKVLDGSKTVESRFTMVKCAPYGRVNPGDTVLIKVSGGPLVGEFIAGRVLSCPLTPDMLAYARSLSAEIGVDNTDATWARTHTKKYMTLVWITDVKPYTPAVPYKRNSQSGWEILAAPPATYQFELGLSPNQR